MLNNAIVAAVAIAAAMAGRLEPESSVPSNPAPALIVVILGAVVAAVGAAALRAGFRRLPHDPGRLARLWNVPVELVVRPSQRDAPVDAEPTADAPGIAPAAAEQAAPGQP
jgi:hypothetical protein